MTYQNFINGQWLKSNSTKTVQNTNPANTDDVLGEIVLATRDEARAAVEAAAEAYRGWRSTPPPTRGRIVAKAARLMNCDYNAYEGRKIKGVVETVLSRGNVVIDGGDFKGRAGAGQFLKRGTCVSM